MSEINIVQTISHDDLAEQVCDSLCYSKNVTEFVMCVDAYMADTAFTADLIKRLTDVLNEEEKFNGAHTA